MTPTSSSDSDAAKQGLFRGLATGLLGPLVTIPIDKMHNKVILNPGIKFTGMVKLLFTPPLIKGYFFTVSSRVPRHIVTYLSQPWLKSHLSSAGVSAAFATPLSFIGAGMADGVVSAPFHVIRQHIYTTHAHNMREVLRTTSTTLLVKKTLASAPLIACRNGIFWATYSLLVQRLEHKTSATNVKKQFSIGAFAGAIASVSSYPFDSLPKHRVKNPDVSVRVLCKNMYKEHGMQIVNKLFYRGLSVTLFRMPVSMGATNVLIHFADRLYQHTKKVI